MFLNRLNAKVLLQANKQIFKGNTMSNVAGKTVLITGASRGIGAAAARHLAAQGANVALMARSTQALNALANEIGPQAMALAGDVSNYDDVKAALTAVQDRFGTLDIAVNNAGVITPIARLADCPPKAWTRVLDINVGGVFHVMHAAIPIMLASGGGTIINISSGAAYNALEGWSHYCASKAAVLQLTRAGHKEYGPRGIRIVGLSPGTIATQMQVDIRASGVNPISQMEMSDHRPPELVAQLIEALCGPKADAYLGMDVRLPTKEGATLLGLAEDYFERPT